MFVQYKGHTLQGSYDGGFVYARKPTLPTTAMAKVSRVARVSVVQLFGVRVHVVCLYPPGLWCNAWTGVVFCLLLLHVIDGSSVLCAGGRLLFFLRRGGCKRLGTCGGVLDACKRGSDARTLSSGLMPRTASSLGG